MKKLEMKQNVKLWKESSKQRRKFGVGSGDPCRLCYAAGAVRMPLSGQGPLPKQPVNFNSSAPIDSRPSPARHPLRG
jgi:hypothetical protein